jgi:hypothetical protein
MRNFLKLSSLWVVLATGFACKFFTAGNEEFLLPATEVGNPSGAKVTKTIGPDGGSLSTADGRMTIAVPPGSVRDPTAFAIQPITNTATSGRGDAYRFEPDGSKFSIPVTLSLKYSDEDIEGTIPEAVTAAFQDKQGHWQTRRTVELDKEAKTISIQTDHFTDFSFLSRMSLSPNKVTLKPGENQVISVHVCEEPSWLDRMRNRTGNCTHVADPGGVFTLSGPGQIDDAGDGNTVYTAPPRRPTPDVAYVTYTFYYFDTGGDDTQSQTMIKHEVNARIKIVDRGFKATGTWGGMRWSGNICDLREPFKILGQAPYLNFIFDMQPNGDGTSGTVSVAGGGTGIVLHNGSGSYTVTGLDQEKPRISLTMDSFQGTAPGVGTATGGGTRIVELEPLPDCAAP